ncbi:MAG: excinuclease ABC subunit UvrC [Xanthobacteraceae bacterium]
MQDPKQNIDPDIELADDEEEPSLPEAIDVELDLAATEPGSLGAGRAVIAKHAALAPAAPGVYRMIAASGDVLYVGKAKNIKKRILAYVRQTGHTARIARMIAATAAIEFVTTATETEALLLEANLIKRLRPRFNVLLRDDKSFPYILITSDRLPPQICKHRGARNRAGDYFGPFAAAYAVNRTITALERAFLIRSCSDAVYESRTRPCLLHQIKRCSAPCTGEISDADYAKLIAEAKDFLSGRSRAVKEELAAEMDHAASALDFERAAVLRDRLAALSLIQTHQGINPRGIEEADVFAVHQDGGFNCIEVFFFRAGQNWGNRAYFPKADRALPAETVLAAFLSQFYDDKPCPRLILVSHRPEECDLLAAAFSLKREMKVEILVPRRGEKKELVDHAAANAREALGRKLAETSSQQRLLGALAATFGLPHPPRRIEVYDNSHIQGTNAVGAMIVAGPEGFQKNQYRKFNIRSAALVPGDDYGMLREVLSRRFKRLLAEAPREVDRAALSADAGSVARGEAASVPDPSAVASDAHDAVSAPPPIVKNEASVASPAVGDAESNTAPEEAPEDASEDPAQSPWPDLVLIDGGAGQLAAAQEILAGLGIADLPLLGIAKGPDRNAGWETFHMPGRAPFSLPPRDPALYFVQRLRDEAHRFAIGSHRQRRSRDLREAGLQDIPGIGPARKRALLRHFGTLKAIERASLADLSQVPGVSSETARRIHDYFHDSSR